MNHPNRLGAIGILALLVIGAVWFGLRLGPRGDSPADSTIPSAEFATMTAKQFVRTAISRQPDALSDPLLTPLNRTGQEHSDPFLWGVTGTGVVRMKDRGFQKIEWTVKERWDAEARTWRLKEIQITRPTK